MSLETQQSPINIIRKNVKSTSPDKVKFEYHNEKYLISKASKQLKLLYDGFREYVKIDNEKYYLRRIKFYQPSLHKINSKSYDLEIHLIHELDKKINYSQSTKELVIMAILVKISNSRDKSNLLFDNILDNMYKREFIYNFNRIIPYKGVFYTYTADFNNYQNVKWIVFSDILYISKNIYNKLKPHIYGKIFLTYVANVNVLIGRKHSPLAKDKKIGLVCDKIPDNQENSLDSFFSKLGKIRYEKFINILLIFLHYLILFIIILIALKLNIICIKPIYKIFQTITGFYCKYKVKVNLTLPNTNI